MDNNPREDLVVVFSGIISTKNCGKKHQEVRCRQRPILLQDDLGYYVKMGVNRYPKSNVESANRSKHPPPVKDICSAPVDSIWNIPINANEIYYRSIENPFLK